jgi:hypothetical protein
LIISLSIIYTVENKRNKAIALKKCLRSIELDPVLNFSYSYVPDIVSIEVIESKAWFVKFL